MKDTKLNVNGTEIPLEHRDSELDERGTLTVKKDTKLEEIARQFHNTYERLAPKFGYKTREDTKDFDPESPNGKLMIAVCGEVVKQYADKKDTELEEILEEFQSFKVENGKLNAWKGNLDPNRVEGWVKQKLKQYADKKVEEREAEIRKVVMSKKPSYSNTWQVDADDILDLLTNKK